MLVAGGDIGGKLGGVINLATSTVSAAAAQVYQTATNTFLLVGSLNTARESAAAVALPNGLTLVAGGETCAATTIGSTSGFECNALNTAELYNESTKSFSFAGSGSGGVMTAARSGPSATLISCTSCGLNGQVLIVGGSTGSSFLGLSTPAGAPTGQVARHDAELYNPATDAFTAVSNPIPACATGVASCSTGLPSVCAGASSSVTAASESGTVVTITSAAPVIIGDSVTIAGITPAGYSGTFTVTGTGAGTFTYTAASGLGTATLSSATAVPNTAECGMVDQGAALIPDGSGRVLLAGGDLVEFLGESSTLSFIFDPATQTFSRTTGSLTTPRELFAVVALDPSVVTGSLAGDLVAFGGIEANSLACVSTPATPTVATTLNTAEVFDPTTQTWSAAANTMGAKRAAVATLIRTGTLAGEVILPGGVDVEAGTLPSTCAATTGLKQAAESETDLYDPAVGTGGTFSATGSLNQAREGAGQGLIVVSATNQVIVIGGACTTPTPSLQSVVIGSSQATITCGTANATNDYSELFSQGGGGSWTVGPTFASGFSPTNGAASAVLP